MNILQRWRNWRRECLQYRLVLANEILKRTGPAIIEEHRYLHIEGAVRYTRTKINHFEALQRIWTRRRESCVRKLGIDQDSVSFYDWMFVQEFLPARFEELKFRIRFYGLKV